MDNDTLRVILSQLETIQRKQDTQGEQLKSITERLTTRGKVHLAQGGLARANASPNLAIV